jgi:hypothetical protein
VPAPLLLTRQGDIPTETHTYLRNVADSARHAYVYGGMQAVGGTTANCIGAAITNAS